MESHCRLLRVRRTRSADVPGAVAGRSPKCVSKTRRRGVSHASGAPGATAPGITGSLDSARYARRGRRGVSTNESGLTPTRLSHFTQHDARERDSPIRVRTSVQPPPRGSDRGDGHVSISGRPPGAQRCHRLWRFGIGRCDRRRDATTNTGGDSPCRRESRGGDEGARAGCSGRRPELDGPAGAGVEEPADALADRFVDLGKEWSVREIGNRLAGPVPVVGECGAGGLRHRGDQ